MYRPQRPVMLHKISLTIANALNQDVLTSHTKQSILSLCQRLAENRDYTQTLPDAISSQSNYTHIQLQKMNLTTGPRIT